MKKVDGIDILKELKAKDLNAVNIAKDGLEDLTLFLSEMEKIYKRLTSDDIDDEERKFLQYKLKVIESYIDKLNKLISSFIHMENKDVTLN
ncbi:hypothetical protein FHQ18_11860 [Deferribacter autotrophicus]|uniref:Uncharacterized protein n=1 Tax=Deferribacter autotrophicus TaxID=500465 RepID=A0A5A8F4S5_9BACT|nr:hypothetical protein [Deferribacter autotrophicus]KAA0256818.1 hypothetical protein FHQ18_11860 [Deferribacter autotrophicus]